MNIDLSPMQGKRVLCAVSGGADSMCLLHYLHSHGIDVVAAHYEHGIRGEESVRDMLFVEQYCESRGIPFTCHRGNVPDYAAFYGMGMEEAARQLRYEFLASQREKYRCRFIATAHNAEDNAETVLMNLIRGSGAKGLSGIPYRRVWLIRPLLGVSRAEIEAYLEENAVPHVEDSTNQSDDYTRNLIRHRIMPLMKQINPGFNEAIARTTSLMRWDEHCLEVLSLEFLDRHEAPDGSIDCAALLEAPFAIGSRALRARLQGLSFEHVTDILAFAAGSGYGELDVPGRRIVRDGGRLYLEVPEHPVLKEQALTVGTELLLREAGLRLRIEICEYTGEVNDLFKTSYLKYEIINSNLRVGPRRAGDKLRPMGRGCTKTLKSLFMEAKIPAAKRDAWPVIRDESGPLLVYGIAMDGRAKPAPGEKALKITFEKINSTTGEKNNAERY